MTLKITLLSAASALVLSAGTAAAVPATAESPVNMRAGPGTQYEVLATIPGGATVDVGGCAANWCQVSYGGESGYANSSYLAMAGEPARSAGVVVAPGYAYDDAPLYSDDYYIYGDTYGPGFRFYANPGHRFPHGHPGWNGSHAGAWQGHPGNWQGRRAASGNHPSGINRGTIGGRPLVSAPVGMQTGGGSAMGVFRGGAGAAGVMRGGAAHTGNGVGSRSQAR